MKKFEGYCPETVDFLWGIRLNNNREWFMEHKPEYVQYLYEPTKALGWELFQPFVDKPGHLLKVSRIYRDARMHHDVPYKESLWVCIRQDVEFWSENPCLYFEINPDKIHYGFFYWKPKTQVLKQLRQDWAASPRKFLKLIRDTEKATGMTIQAQTYKRPPEQAPSKELERFFGWRGCISCVIEEEFSEKTFGPELSQRVGEFFEKLTPLYEYFTQYKA